MVTAALSPTSAAGVGGQVLLVLAGVLGCALILVAGAWLGRRERSGVAARPWAATRTWVVGARDVAGHRLGRAAAAAAALAVGLVIAVAITVAVGLATRAGIVTAPDRALAHFVSGHRLRTMTSLMAAGTLLGSYPVISAVALTAGIVTGLSSGLWLPLFVLAAAELGEIVIQGGVGSFVHAAKPPQATAIGPAGGYFSGGSARVVLIFGLAACFLAWGVADRKRKAFIWTSVALAAFIEGYSRLYLGRHWLADIFGGWLFGALALTAFVIAAGALRPAGEPVAAPKEEAAMAPSHPPAPTTTPRGNAAGTPSRPGRGVSDDG